MTQIEHLVVLMLENRSLDNVLGWLYTNRAPQNFSPAPDTTPYDGLAPGRYSCPADSIWGVKRYGVTALAVSDTRIPSYDPNEEYDGVVNQLFGTENAVHREPAPGNVPKMEGFLQDYYARYMLTYQGLDVLWTFTPSQLPAINNLAWQYGVSDRWYSSVPTQTNPNRAYSLCGTSLGRDNNLNIAAVEQFAAPTLFNALSGANRSWAIYFHDEWREGKCFTEYTFPMLGNAGDQEIAVIDRFYERAANGTLPSFTYLEPKWGYGKGAFFVQGNDYHPPTDVAPADRFLWRVYSALRSNETAWSKTLFVVLFDEHGGTYDHNPPPWGAINPDGLRSANGFAFNRFGVRVPALLASPYIAPQTVFRAPRGGFPFDHTSLIKTTLLWAGVNPDSVQMGKRMPEAPTFDAVLSNSIVNPGWASPPAPRTAALAAPRAAAAGSGLGGAVNALVEGIPASDVRAMVDASETIAELNAAADAYRRDPVRFATLYHRRRK
jgi:phospholipase C